MPVSLDFQKFKPLVLFRQFCRQFIDRLISHVIDFTFLLRIDFQLLIGQLLFDLLYRALHILRLPNVSAIIGGLFGLSLRIQKGILFIEVSVLQRVTLLRLVNLRNRRSQQLSFEYLIN